MLDEKEHESKLKEAQRLSKKLEIRKVLQGKLYYIYPDVFEGIFDVLSVSERGDFFFSLLMHFAERTIQEYPGDKDEVRINWWLEPNISYSLLVQEIFDDYWASFLCFQHGFTKQAIEILRNTFELVIFLCYMKLCKQEWDEPIIKWLEGSRGIEKMQPMIAAVKKIEFFKAENISPYLKQLYSIQCMATHSHKKSMTSVTVPGVLSVKEKAMFESFIVLQTRSIFLFVVEVELKMIKHLIKQDIETRFTQKILDAVTRMEEHLEKYSKVIESIKKGYVLHREQVSLSSGRSVLVSLKINNEWELKGKRSTSLSPEETKELRKRIEELLLGSATLE